MKDLKSRGKNHTMQHSKFCYACGQARSRSKLVYHIPTMRAYCADLKDCENKAGNPQYLKQAFPDSKEYQTELVKATDFEAISRELENYFSDEALGWIYKFLGKSISARVEPYQSIYMSKAAKMNGLDTIQDTIRFIIEDYIKRNREELDKVRLDENESL